MRMNNLVDFKRALALIAADLNSIATKLQKFAPVTTTKKRSVKKS